MAADVLQIGCELCNRLKFSCNHHSKTMKFSVQFVLASLTGVAFALLASYLPSFLSPWFRSRPSLLPHTGERFNIILAPEKLPETVPIDKEALAAVRLAIQMSSEGKRDKAHKLFQQAYALSPYHPDTLLSFGEFLEEEDVLKAEHLYATALIFSPDDSRAVTNRQRTLPKVQQLDREMLDRIDKKREKLFSLPKGSLPLKRAMREAYFQHIYHSNAIEGNTMTLSMTRAIVETRMAVPGKSIQEHNDVLGLDLALKYINSTLLQKPESINVEDILQIHKRVLGHAHPLEAGIFRSTQVYVGDHTPPHPTEVENYMEELNEWLTSEEVTRLHPVEFAALAHYKLVYIHPFTDGNGRTSRLLMNSILMRAGFPPVIIRVQQRHDYYEYLDQANKGDIRPFIRFVAACTEATIDAYLQATMIYPIGHEKHPEITDEHKMEKILRSQ